MKRDQCKWHPSGPPTPSSSPRGRYAKPLDGAIRRGLLADEPVYLVMGEQR